MYSPALLVPGKTTIAEKLAGCGFTIRNEIFREYVDWCKKTKNLTDVALPLYLDTVESHIEALNDWYLKRELELNPNETIILDRSVVDQRAYFEFHGHDPSIATQKSGAHIDQIRYKLVFLFEALPDFILDGFRLESPLQRIKLNELLKKSYLDAGYEVVPVPFMPVDERLAFVLDKIKK